MAVFYYEGDSHGTGFEGFRVARTIGCNDDYRQAYFSLKDMEYETAKKKAERQDKKWEEEAKAIKRESRTSQHHVRDNIIAPGFRAEISVERRKTKAGIVVYFYPCFLVKRLGKKESSAMFRTSLHGYRTAYQKATDFFCELHGLSAKQRKQLLLSMPEPKVFTEFLLNRVHDRSFDITQAELIEKLRIDS